MEGNLLWRPTVPRDPSHGYGDIDVSLSSRIAQWV